MKKSYRQNRVSISIRRSPIKLYYVTWLALRFGFVSFALYKPKKDGAEGEEELKNSIGKYEPKANVSFYDSEKYRTLLEFLILILSMVVIFSVSLLLSIYRQRSQ